jgi:hypothetical protein
MAAMIVARSLYKYLKINNKFYIMARLINGDLFAVGLD